MYMNPNFVKKNCMSSLNARSLTYERRILLSPDMKRRNKELALTNNTVIGTLVISLVLPVYRELQ